MVTPELAARFAAVALDNIAREYPNQPGHVQAGPDDLRPTRELHPSFHGSYDWHSCVHMHWLLARLRRTFPALPQRAAIDAAFDRSFAPEAIAGELAYLERPHTQSFERTYGWAWLLKLASELAEAPDPQARRWAGEIAPLATAFVKRYQAFLPKARYPIRHGNHPNSAFGLGFALEYARTAGEEALERLCVATALAWFGTDRDAPAAWEPCGADFLSPSLMEANLMRQVLPAEGFADWLAAFLPGLARGVPAGLFTPVKVADRADPQIVHLDGLNLSRAWCLRAIARALPEGDSRAPVLHAAADAHLAAGMTGLGSGEFVGEHWLATFAVLALDA
jgi:hypothetical protein